MSFKSIFPICALMALIFASPLYAGINKQQTISLGSGSWCYVVYEGGNPKAPSVFVEISTAVDDQCDNKSKSTLLGKEMVLSLVEAGKQALTVSPASTMELISSGDGSTNQWPIQAMKNGVVKFYNKTVQGNSSDPVLPSDRDNAQLILPQELRDLIEDSARKADRVFIILREVAKGKKGLNAVNVKLS